jgi:D-amino-acid oxidase
MKDRVAVVGAGVSGLTCATLFAEGGYHTAIFAEETGDRTTSAVAAAIWYPYDAEPADKVIAWALDTYKVLVDLCHEPQNGVSLIELRTFSRTREIQIPEWAIPLGARRLPGSVMSSEVETSLAIPPNKIPAGFTSGFALAVPLMDTTIYLDYLTKRFVSAGGVIHENIRFDAFEDVDREFALIINCSGIGAKTLVPDADLESHRGQIATVPKIDVSYAIACDDEPLIYAIPRTNDCFFGGTNELSDNREVDPSATLRIVAECARILNLRAPKVLAERVGLRPFRKSGVCLHADQLRDGRTVIHNYGHGGSGFTLSWGCAQKVLKLADNFYAGNDPTSAQSPERS